MSGGRWRRCHPPPFSPGGSVGDRPGAVPALGATSPARWRQLAATTPSGSSRRARPLTRSSPPSASPPTFPGLTRRTSTAWPGTRRSRACWPPAVTTARSPSGSTSAPKFAERFNPLYNPPYSAEGPFGAAAGTQPHASTESRAGKTVTDLLCPTSWDFCMPRTHQPPWGCAGERDTSAGMRPALGDRTGLAPLSFCPTLNKSVLSLVKASGSSLCPSPPG